MSDKKERVLSEEWGNTGKVTKYSLTRDHFRSTSDVRPFWNSGTSFLSDFLRQAFLPEGYPHTVSSDYLEYQKWDSLQALCSSITGLLSTQAVLKGVGVGDANATAAAAVLQWVIRDGTGRFGHIFFAWSQGNDLDSNSKFWRLMADVLNDAALALEVISPNFPNLFVLIISTASLFRAAVGVAGGATRAAIRQHQSRSGNMADVSAKDGSQETATGLIGMVLGFFLASSSLMEDPTSIALLFILFSVLHIWSNYLAVIAVVFDTLNRQRFYLLMKRIERGDTKYISPEDIAKVESVWLPDRGRMKVILGSNFSALKCSPREIEELLNLYSKERYLLHYDGRSVHVILEKNVDHNDIIKAYHHACIVERLSKESRHVDLRAAYATASSNFERTMNLLDSHGWNVKESHLLCPEQWRATWIKEE
ncbi:hypothetical protein PROFUN_14198 [Planoprotostelium fungivorum]|uniref:Uncharacterized protein n=1 Tax=Planoprotostelium fungivorum TaxID=1890364 RepID=A0A2P6N361_9EUKA|nr:hypothetical protein PROFUN_14198 [Planoprotostelium fungivorum]